MIQITPTHFILRPRQASEELAIGFAYVIVPQDFIDATAFLEAPTSTHGYGFRCIACLTLANTGCNSLQISAPSIANKSAAALHGTAESLTYLLEKLKGGDVSCHRLVPFCPNRNGDCLKFLQTRLSSISKMTLHGLKTSYVRMPGSCSIFEMCIGRPEGKAPIATGSVILPLAVPVLNPVPVRRNRDFAAFSHLHVPADIQCKS